MTRLVLPIILVIASLALFIVYTNPTYQASKATASEVSSYDDALNKSKELLAIRDKLNSKRGAFPVGGESKLSSVLPDNVDNIRLIIDINTIASRHGLPLTNPQIGDVSGSRSATNPLAAGNSGDPVGSVTIGFSVTASYADMLAFLADLEHSLRIIDVQNLSFTYAGNATVYSFTIRTYWLH